MHPLFAPLDLRGVTLRNRLGVSPMCTYSCENRDGRANEWHLHHLGSFAAGGFGLIVSEATAVSPEGRISPQDAGIWDDGHVDAWRPVTAFVRAMGGAPVIQLAHAGNKAGSRRPWDGGGPADVDWPVVGPSDESWPRMHPVRKLETADVRRVQDDFVAAAVRSIDAGFVGVELHAAHGYLLHSVYSPISNRLDAPYGGDFEGRTRMLRETATRVREAIGPDAALLVRLSASDWAEGGWTIEDTVRLSVELKARGVDLVDLSSGGATPNATIPVGPGYQVPFAEAVRKAGVPSACVGMITTPEQAAEIVTSGRADVVLLGREALRDPHFPQRAAALFGEKIPCPPQYERAW